MATLRYILLSALLAVVHSSTQAMIWDNRYFSLLYEPYISIEDTNSYFSWNIFVTTASRAFLPNFSSELANRTTENGIPEIWGFFDQGKLADAMVLAGYPDPLAGLNGLFSVNLNVNKAPTRSIPWRLFGKVQSQGFMFRCQQQFTKHFEAGCVFYVMRATTNIEYLLAKEGITTEEALQLDEVRRQMLDELCITQNAADRASVGDVDLYVRLSDTWDYVLKCKRIDMGVRAGAIFPAGLRRNLNSPSTVPFGGNGHYGFYAAVDAEFELKDDMKVGLWCGAIKRFARVDIERMPSADESILFGTLVGPARVSPGPSLGVSPYIQLDHIREGLGARIQLTMLKHWKDSWEDRRCDPRVPVHFCNVEKFSAWGEEAVTLNLFYDFGVRYRNFSPTAYLSWDIPVEWKVANRVAKAQKIALGLQMSW